MLQLCSLRNCNSVVLVAQ